MAISNDFRQIRAVFDDETITVYQAYNYSIATAALQAQTFVAPFKFDTGLFCTKPVRIQWDPERDISLNKLEKRSIQIGIGSEAVEKYVNEWIVEIQDITIKMKEIGKLVEDGEFEKAKNLLPDEKIYPTNEEIAKIIESS